MTKLNNKVYNFAKATEERMTQTMLVCVGRFGDDNCGWMEECERAPEKAPKFLTCPECNGRLHEKTVEEDADLNVVAKNAYEKYTN